MKAIIEFNLSDSDDVLDYKRVNKSLDMALALWEIVYNTRKKIYYELEANDFKSDPIVYDKYKAVDLVFEKINEILNEHNINLDEIIE